MRINELISLTVENYDSIVYAILYDTNFSKSVFGNPGNVPNCADFAH